MQQDFSTHRELMEKPATLPDAIEELVDFVIVGNEAVQSFKAKLRACDKAGLAFEAKEQALRDGCKISRLVIDAEVRLGEILSKTDKQGKTKEYGSTGGTIPTLPVGVDKRESHYAQEIYRHPGIIEEIFTTKTNDIPTRYDILKKIKETKREQKIQEQREEIQKGIEQPKGKYDIIVIDPPWKFEGKYDADGRRTTAPYPQMSYEEIKNIQIPAKDNCILWLWTTHKDIPISFDIIKNWGFNYKGILVWDKIKMGIGTWLRFQCEFCILSVKGKPLWEKKDIRDIIKESRTQHSVKPASFYNMIDENFIGKKLDYFGRKKRKGWDIYGAGQNSV